MRSPRWPQIINGVILMKKAKATVLVGFVLFALFLVFTYLAGHVDVAPIGPNGSMVGFSAINGAFRDTVGLNKFWYYLTEVYGYLSLLLMAAFAFLGVYKLIKFKSIKKVDPEIICLGVFYVIVLGIYVFFEKFIVNFRPVILDAEEGLEASYPSSHIMLIVFVMGSTAVAIASMVRKETVSYAKAIVLTCDIIGITGIVGRLLSGVHWLTDIFAGLVAATSLLIIFQGVIGIINEKRETK